MEAQPFNGRRSRGTTVQGGIPPRAGLVLRALCLFLLAGAFTLAPPLLAIPDGGLIGLAFAGNGNDQGGNNQGGNDQGENDQGGSGDAGMDGPRAADGGTDGGTAGGGVSEHWILNGAIPDGAAAAGTGSAAGPEFTATILTEEEEAAAIAAGWPEPGK